MKTIEEYRKDYLALSTEKRNSLQNDFNYYLQFCKDWELICMVLKKMPRR